MSIKTRLTKAEKATGTNDLIPIVARQDWDDPDVFTHGDQVYTAAELDELSEAGTHDILRIVYVDDWRGDGKAKRIDLDWGDD